MAVYVYEDNQKLKCLCVLEDDGYVYDRPYSPSDPLTREILGNVGYDHRIYRGKDQYNKAGIADWQGYIYNDMDGAFPANRVGYVFRNEVYEEGPTSGSYPISRRLAYMEGDGDFVSAGAAAVLLVLNGAEGGGEGYSGGYSSSGGYSPGSCSEVFIPIFSVIAAIVGIIYFLIFVDGCSEKLEDDFESKNPKVEQSTQKSDEEEGWYSVNDSYGYYRTAFLNEGAEDSFTFTYTLGRDATLSFNIMPDKNDLRTSAYIIYNGENYNINTRIKARSGEQIVVIVTQVSGTTGWYKINCNESDF